MYDLLDDDNMSVTSVNQHSSNEELDEVEDKMPEIKGKKVCLNIIDFKKQMRRIFFRKKLI